MQFAVLFIVAFLFGLAIYWFNRKWMIAVSIPMLLFLVTTLADYEAREAWAFTLSLFCESSGGLCATAERN